MTKSYVIAINAVSGGGKTALASLLHRSLTDSALFCFDDFDATNIYPNNFYEWHLRGGNLEEFDCSGMRAAVDEEIRQGKKKYIVLDYPFGREHSRFRELINLSVWLDTPLDVAMARRILRDYPASSSLNQLREDLNEYLVRGRLLYLDSRHRDACDLILDGSKPLEELRDLIVGKLPA
jgi:uridine kinase